MCGAARPATTEPALLVVTSSAASHSMGCRPKGLAGVPGTILLTCAGVAGTAAAAGRAGVIGTPSAGRSDGGSARCSTLLTAARVAAYVRTPGFCGGNFKFRLPDGFDITALPVSDEADNGNAGAREPEDGVSGVSFGVSPGRVPGDRADWLCDAGGQRDAAMCPWTLAVATCGLAMSEDVQPLAPLELPRRNSGGVLG